MRKIEMLYEGAAAEALQRLKQSLDQMTKAEKPAEFTLTVPELWRRLFSARCRRYGLNPYRYKRNSVTP